MLAGCEVVFMTKGTYHLASIFVSNKSWRECLCVRVTIMGREDTGEDMVVYIPPR